MSQLYNNQPLLDQLATALDREKLHHANLISSGPGEEGLVVGIALAARILCDTQNHCGTCKSCKQVGALQHPDLHFSFPFVSGGTSGTADDFLTDFRAALGENKYLDPDSWQQKITSKNQQLQIPVKEIQNIHKKLSLTAASGKNRVLLLWMPEQIKSQASNKLLKLIEEPLPKTYIILVTHRKSRLLPTIVSRCAPWHCKPLEEGHFLDHFKDQPVATAKLLAMVFAPNLGAAISTSEDAESTQIDVFAHWMRTCYKGAPTEISGVVSNLSGMTKEALKTLIFRSQHFLERGFYHNVQNTPVQATDLGAINVQKLSSAVRPSGAMAISRVLNACLYDLERNVHVKTALTFASFELHKAFRGN
jgi:DNA polymerase-3 subunit delta'